MKKLERNTKAILKDLLITNHRFDVEVIVTRPDPSNSNNWVVVYDGIYLSMPIDRIIPIKDTKKGL